MQLLLTRALDDLHQECSAWLENLLTELDDPVVQVDRVHMVDEAITDEVRHGVRAHQVRLLIVELL